MFIIGCDVVTTSELLRGVTYNKMNFVHSRISRSSSVGHIPHSILSTARAERHANVTNEKDAAKLQVKKRKTEDAVKKTEVEYYNVCVHAERSRLEQFIYSYGKVGYYLSILE